MPQTPSAERRRRRRFAILLSSFFLLCVILHIYHRIVDRRAWPERATEEDVPNLSPSPIPAELTIPDATNAWHFFASLPVPYEDFPDVHANAMRELAALRTPVSATNATPALDDWIAKMVPALERWHQAAETSPESYCDSPDLQSQYAVLGKARECAILTPVLAGRARRTGDWGRCRALWLDTLINAPKVTFGTGTAGQVVAYDMTLRATRDIIAALPEMPSDIRDEWNQSLEGIAMLRAQPLHESILHDGVAARAVIGSFFPDNPTFGAPPPGLTPPSGFFRWLARCNGSSPDVSTAHYDAILSHVIAAAKAPYSADGLYGKLPAWCRGRRPPWTNDPAAALAVCALRDNTISAGVYPVLREMELQAALYALRLETAGGAGNQSPVLCEAPADPFSTNCAPFVLDAPPPAWRFHSVGPDQFNDGGSNDWARAEKPGPGMDFLFASPRAFSPGADADSGKN